MLRKRAFYSAQTKKISQYEKCPQRFKKPYIKLKVRIIFPQMKKNFGENLQPLQVDPITGEYYLIVPEEIVNELSWYEDTEISFVLDGNEVILSEHKDD